MKNILVIILLLGIQYAAAGQKTNDQKAFIKIEAEDFVNQHNDEVRRWYRIDAKNEPVVIPDPDGNHSALASGNAYMEVLPDTRVTHDDPLIKAVNFSNEPGKMAIISYNVKFKKPGRYYVWVRAYSTGTEDNGLHVGLDGQWPESGMRMQWCEGKNQWTWASKQRTEANHCGEPYLIYLDVEKKGKHSVQFSMREDGFEFDAFILTPDRNFKY